MQALLMLFYNLSVTICCLQTVGNSSRGDKCRLCLGGVGHYPPGGGHCGAESKPEVEVRLQATVRRAEVIYSLCIA